MVCRDRDVEVDRDPESELAQQHGEHQERRAPNPLPQTHLVRHSEGQNALLDATPDVRRAVYVERGCRLKARAGVAPRPSVPDRSTQARGCGLMAATARLSTGGSCTSACLLTGILHIASPSRCRVRSRGMTPASCARAMSMFTRDRTPPVTTSS